MGKCKIGTGFDDFSGLGFARPGLPYGGASSSYAVVRLGFVDFWPLGLRPCKTLERVSHACLGLGMLIDEGLWGWKNPLCEDFGA